MNTNNILSVFLIIVISYLIFQENDMKIYPVMVGVGIISYGFTKNIITSLLLSTLLSYSLVVLLYKNYKKSILEKMTNRQTKKAEEEAEEAEEEAEETENCAPPQQCPCSPPRPRGGALGAAPSPGGVLAAQKLLELCKASW